MGQLRQNGFFSKLGLIGSILAFCSFTITSVEAARVSDVANTKHNLSMTWGGTGSDPRVVKATSEQRICVFCHTPHAAKTAMGTPLWNRKLVGDSGYTATYQMYDSSSMDASALAGGPPTAPTNSSKLCLSCHDGVIAIGTVNVLGGKANVTIDMTGAGALGEMPDGTVATSGNSRNLGVDLTNDHPISIAYNLDLATADGELADPTTSPHIGTRAPREKPLIPLIPDPNDGNIPKLECVSCHDPHIRDDGGADIKFLRLNRFQVNTDPAALGSNANLVNFNENNDIICLACHNKEGWVDSAHANELVADESYNATAASARDFTAGMKVWEAACLNCHDTHTVAGSRRLLREGTDSTPGVGEVLKPGNGGSAIEETCYQCHSSDTYQYYVLDGVNAAVPDIRTDFSLTYRMPITTTDQQASQEVHDIGTSNPDVASTGGKDFVESMSLLGRGANSGINGNTLGTANYTNRHVECTDCHNPHRVTKNRLANTPPATPDAAGTHDHSAATHTNIISGVLRGSWGVEPTYTSSSFNNSDISYTVKRGVPPQNGTMNVTDSYVTREYQVCLKCHSNYAFDDSTGTTPPELGTSGGSTAYGTNGLTNYTNQAREFQGPAGHQGLTGSPGDSGAFAGVPPGIPGGDPSYSVDFQTNNRRGWHPVMAPTGRSSVRVFESKDMNAGTSGSAFKAPWNNAVGTQTMYCSDCHGSATAVGTVEPNGGEDGSPWGPHGSTNGFILKGRFSTAADGTGTGTGYADDICFKCHDYNAYALTGVGGTTQTYMSGFSGQGTYNKMYNMHLEHANRLNKMRCTWCHAAVPHGFKNKALLVNLNDLGPEATCRQDDVDDQVGCTLGEPMAPGTQVRLGGLPSPGGSTDPYYWNKFGHGYNNPPYYMNAANKIINFKDSGAWTAQDCGSVGSPGTGTIGMCADTQWAVGTEGCNALP